MTINPRRYSPVVQLVERCTVNADVGGSSPSGRAIWDEQSQKLCFSLYLRTFSAVRTFAITWLDTSEAVFIGTSEFSEETLIFLFISERLEPRVERISFFLPLAGFEFYHGVLHEIKGFISKFNPLVYLITNCVPVDIVLL